MMQSIIIASAFLLLFTAQQGAAIKCYICNSHSDIDCEKDIPPETLLKDCREEQPAKIKAPSTYCRKITQVIEFTVNSLPPDSRVIRTCGWKNQTSIDSCYQRAGFGGRQVVCSCDRDGCNAAGSLKSSYILNLYLILLFGLILLFERV